MCVCRWTIDEPGDRLETKFPDDNRLVERYNRFRYFVARVSCVLLFRFIYFPFFFFFHFFPNEHTRYVDPERSSIVHGGGTRYGRCLYRVGSGLPNSFLARQSNRIVLCACVFVFVLFVFFFSFFSFSFFSLSFMRLASSAMQRFGTLDVLLFRTSEWCLNYLVRPPPRLSA